MKRYYTNGLRFETMAEAIEEAKVTHTPIYEVTLSFGKEGK